MVLIKAPVAGLDTPQQQRAAIRETTLGVGPLELDLLQRTARRGDRPIQLLPREFRLLKYIMRRRDEVLSRAILLKEIWNYIDCSVPLVTTPARPAADSMSATVDHR